MGFFKEFKEDLSEAVDELIPGGDTASDADDDMLLDVEQSIDADQELSKLDGLLEKATKKAEEQESREQAAPAPKVTSSADFVAEQKQSKAKSTVNKRVNLEETKMEETLKNGSKDIEMELNTAAPAPSSGSMAPASDENAVITGGMKITGDLESTGSIDIEGVIQGNVKCNGKLTVTGSIIGNSVSAEFFADSAKIEGEVNTSGTVKIGVGSVVVGNITATSAVIAGAVKGDIDVQGPVVVDTSAVVMGNIKSRSVQINNGAVIEGFCSQAYAEVDVASVFA